jgi:hypothetical protein
MSGGPEAAPEAAGEAAPEAVFSRDGDAFVPSIHARGPWDAGSMHGGAPTALLARAIEGLATPGPMRCVRLAVEFPGAVPMMAVRAARGSRGRGASSRWPRRR